MITDDEKKFGRYLWWLKNQARVWNNYSALQDALRIQVPDVADPTYPNVIATRRIAVDLLAWEMGGGRAVDILLEYIRDRDPHVIDVATRFLSFHGQERALDPLIKVSMEDDKWEWGRSHHPEVVKPADYAVVALGLIGGKKSVQALIKALSLGDIFTVERAVKSLGQIGDRQAIGPLLILLRRESWAERTLPPTKETLSQTIVTAMARIIQDDEFDKQHFWGLEPNHDFLTCEVCLGIIQECSQIEYGAH